MSGITTGEGSGSCCRRPPHGQVTWIRIYMGPVSARPFRRDAVDSVVLLLFRFTWEQHTRVLKAKRALYLQYLSALL